MLSPVDSRGPSGRNRGGAAHTSRARATRARAAQGKQGRSMATTTETHEIGNTEEVAARKLVARGRVGRRVGPGPGRLAAPTCTLKTVRTSL